MVIELKEGRLYTLSITYEDETYEEVYIKADTDKDYFRMANHIIAHKLEEKAITTTFISFKHKQLIYGE